MVRMVRSLADRTFQLCRQRLRVGGGIGVVLDCLPDPLHLALLGPTLSEGTLVCVFPRTLGIAHVLQLRAVRFELAVLQLALLLARHLTKRVVCAYLR